MPLSLLTSQMIAAAILFFSTLICGTCPTWIGTTVAKKKAKKRLRQERLLRDSGMSSVAKTTIEVEPGCSHSHDDMQKHPSQNNVSMMSSQISTVSAAPSMMASNLWKNTLSFLMNFGGGVLLATSILHMLPEVRENFTDKSSSNPGSLLDSFTSLNASDQDDINDRIRQFVLLSRDQSIGSDSEGVISKLSCGLPITELLVCAGFFLIFLAEELVHAFLSHSQPEFFGPDKPGQENANPSLSSSSLKNKGKEKLLNRRREHLKLIDETQECCENEEGGSVFVVCSDKQALIPSSGRGRKSVKITDSTSTTGILKNKSNCCSNSSKVAAYGAIVSMDGSHVGESSQKVTITGNQEESDPLLQPASCAVSSSCTRQGNSVVVCCRDRDCSQDVDDDCQDCDDRHTFTATATSSSEADANLSVFRCIMIVFALSFHSIFDGLAIGLQDTTAHMIQLMVAVSMHKLLIAFVVGLEIFSATKRASRVFLYMLPFSLMSPIGLIVAAVTKLNLGESVVGILTGLSTGSLLYITFFEILLREKTTSKLPGLIQFLAVFAGFCLMAILQTLTEH